MAVQFKDYYKILGVERDASEDEIKRRYRELAKKYHPDRNKGKEAADRFNEVREAYEVLKDPQKRARYDQFGNRPQGQDFQPPPGWENVQFQFRGSPGGARGPHFEGFSDFFRMVFGDAIREDDERSFGFGGEGFGGFPGGFAQTRSASRPGRDQEADLEIDLEDAYHGATRQVQLQLRQVQPDGQVEERTRTYNVTIPKGASSGTRIRLRGQGTAGTGQGQAGDLVLTLHVREHPQFRREGDDLRTTLRVTPWEAALGARVPVPTLDGPVQMRVPAGSSGGSVLRLRGKGMPTTSGGRGDQLVTLQIVLPKSLSDREKELFAALRDASNFEPR